MDLLLQAARVLELEHDDDDGSGHQGDDRLISPRGTYFHHAKSRNENGEESNESKLYDDNLISTGDDLPLAERTSRRLGGVGTREAHNQLEKNRRKQLREFFTYLQQCVPSLENKRVATQSILQAAIKHIKTLKKRDVEQEREIQTLARRKSDLKKKYDLEFNKCTEEQQQVAGVLLKVIKPKVDVVSVEQDGHTSDSTSTASEGPSNEDDFSDAEKDGELRPLKLATPGGNCEGRKRKFPQRENLSHDAEMIDLTSSNSKLGVSARSLVSSSSVALKQLLEQRKRNQTATGQANSVPRGAQASGLPTRSPGSLTYSYPMITTHLASTIRPSISKSSHGVTQTNQAISQSSAAAVSSAIFSKNTISSSSSPTVSSTQSTAVTFLTKRNKKGTHIRSKSDNISHTSHNSVIPSQVLINSTPLHLSSNVPLTLTQNPALFPATIKLVQTPTVTAKSHNARNADFSFTAVPKIITSVSNLDIQNFSYLGEAVMGNQTGALTLEPPTSIKRIMDTSISSHKIFPTVIPLSLSPILCGLPVASGLSSHVVALGSSPLALCSSTGAQPSTSIAEVAASSLLNNKVQLPQSSSYLLASSPVTTQQNSLALSANTARIATVLPASSSHINSISCSNSIIKPVSPINSIHSSICPTSIAIPVTIAQSLIPFINKWPSGHKDVIFPLTGQPAVFLHTAVPEFRVASVPDEWPVSSDCQAGNIRPSCPSTQSHSLPTISGPEPVPKTDPVHRCDGNSRL